MPFGGVNSNKLILQLLLLFSSLAAACNPAARHRVLNIFFDGVPPLEKARSEAAADTLQIEADQGLLPDSTSAIPAFSFHPKLDNRECKPCHDVGQSFRLYEEPENLCFKCHDLAGAKFIHAPVEEGACVECHNPHGTTNPHLLIEPGQALCFQCHDEDDIESLEKHEKIADGACSECHNPHSADNRYFLR